MFLFVLKRKESKPGEVKTMFVAALNVTHARNVAAQDCGVEGPEPWQGIEGSYVSLFTAGNQQRVIVKKMCNEPDIIVPVLEQAAS